MRARTAPGESESNVLSNFAENTFSNAGTTTAPFEAFVLVLPAVVAAALVVLPSGFLTTRI